MTESGEITSINPAACGSCKQRFEIDDLVKRCPQCDELLHSTCWGNAAKCPLCGQVTTGGPERVFKGGGNALREASTNEIEGD